jgi:hypothetical protein
MIQHPKNSYIFLLINFNNCRLKIDEVLQRVNKIWPTRNRSPSTTLSFSTRILSRDGLSRMKSDHQLFFFRLPNGLEKAELYLENR